MCFYPMSPLLVLDECGNATRMASSMSWPVYASPRQRAQVVASARQYHHGEQDGGPPGWKHRVQDTVLLALVLFDLLVKYLAPGCPDRGGKLVARVIHKPPGLLPAPVAPTNTTRTFHPISPVIHLPLPLPRPQNQQPWPFKQVKQPISQGRWPSGRDACLEAICPLATPDRSPRVQFPVRPTKFDAGLR